MEKRKSTHPESKLQQQCVKWFNTQYPKHLLFAIPNGGYRSVIEAKIMKGEGVISGVADLFLMFPNSKYNGLFIEMKYGSGKLTENQKEFESKATFYGYEYIVCRTINEFMNTINNYING